MRSPKPLFSHLLPVLGMIIVGVCSALHAQQNHRGGGTFSGEVFADYFYNVRQVDITRKWVNGFQ